MDNSVLGVTFILRNMDCGGRLGDLARERFVSFNKNLSNFSKVLLFFDKSVYICISINNKTD